MQSFIRNPKDFWSGVMFIVFGAIAVYIAGDYSMGSAGRMGPAYFPTVLGWILIALGGISVVRSLMTAGEAIERFAMKELTIILVAILIFAATVRGAGLLIGLPALVIVSAYASKKFTWVATIALAIGMTVFSALLFVKALGLPIPLIGSWFGY